MNQINKIPRKKYQNQIRKNEIYADVTNESGIISLNAMKSYIHSHKFNVLTIKMQCKAILLLSNLIYLLIYNQRLHKPPVKIYMGGYIDQDKKHSQS